MNMKIASNKKLLGIESGYLLNLLLFYVIAQGGILLIPNAIFWDDWILYGISHKAILDTFDSAGAMFNIAGYLHIAMLAAGPWLYKVLTFVLMFLSGVMLWKILERITWIKVEARYLIVLLFLVLPLSSARVAMINFPAILCTFLFFLAWYLQGKKRWLALGFFFLSFNVHSLLVFYVLPMADRLFRDNGNFRFKMVLKWAIRNVDFMILPFAYWFIKTVFFKPYGAYAGYNQTFTLKGSIANLILVWEDMRALEFDGFLLAVFLGLAFFLVKKRAFGARILSLKLLEAGAIAFVCGLLPYWVIGAIPTFSEWTSRHQLLLPLGMALLLVGLLTCAPYWAQRVGYVAAIAISLTLSVQVYTAFYQDWSKQQELLSLIAKSDQIRGSKLVLFDDHTENAIGRSYRFYEWNGLMKFAYGDESRFGLPWPWPVDAYRRGEYNRYFDEKYNAKSHLKVADQRPVMVVIDYVPGATDKIRRLARSLRAESNYRIAVWPVSIPASTAPQPSFLGATQPNTGHP